MLVALRLDQRRQFRSVCTESGMSLFSQHQPVMPIPDLVLQLLERLAHSARIPVVPA